MCAYFLFASHTHKQLRFHEWKRIHICIRSHISLTNQNDPRRGSMATHFIWSAIQIDTNAHRANWPHRKHTHPYTSHHTFLTVKWRFNGKVSQLKNINHDSSPTPTRSKTSNANEWFFLFSISMQFVTFAVCVYFFHSTRDFSFFFQHDQ